MTRREVHGVMAAAGLLAMLVAALAFILRTASDLETAEREARRLATHEERVRLALWRLDSTLSGFLAYENVRPPGALPKERESDQDQDEAYVARRFEISPEEIGPEEPDPSLPSFAFLRAQLAQVDAEELPVFGIASRALPNDLPPAGGPVALEAESQLLANTAEFSQRQSFASQQSQFVLPPGGRTATSRSETRVGLLRPVWQDVDGAMSLFLVRRVDRAGREKLQGMELDLAATRRALLAEVRDLLPAATLVPVLDPAAADPARRLALLPLRLEPGLPPPLPQVPGWSAGRLGLTAAVAAVALVALAGGLLLLAALRLAHRRSDFASAVIHELRTPLTTFRFYTDMLAEGMVAESDRQSYAETLRREADRLGHLVENVLAYSRLERQGRAPDAMSQAETVDLGDWVRETFSRLQQLAESEGFSFSRRGSLPEGWMLTADALAAERILFNLCDNSCKYGRGKEASIEARIEVSPAAAIDADTDAESGRATIRWRDHGPGLGRAARRDLFRAFRRGDVEGTAGIGLGLSLSRRLARGFGGELRLLDVGGPGTAFELTLPIRADAGPADTLHP